MRKSARNRIIIWSAVSLVLIAVLVASMAVCSNISGGISDKIKLKKETEGFTIANFQKFNPDDVNSLIIGWAAGEVEIKPTDDYQITIEQQSVSSSDTAKGMAYKLNNNGELKIFSSMAERSFTGLSLSGLRKMIDKHFNNPSKLVVSIPQGYKYDFSVNTASANIDMNEIYALNVSFASASGYITTNNLICETLNIDAVSGGTNIKALSVGDTYVDTVSGNIRLEGSFERITMDSVSADLSYIETVMSFSSLEVNSVSGSVELTLPENIKGFAVENDSVDGKINSEFAGRMVDGRYEYGDASAHIDVNCVSGRLNIVKSKS